MHKTVIEMPYDEAQTFFHELTGVKIWLRAHPHYVHQPQCGAEGLHGVEILRHRAMTFKRRIAGRMAAGKWRRPVVVSTGDHHDNYLMAYAIILCPFSPRDLHESHLSSRLKDARGPSAPSGQRAWREPKGFRFYLVDEGRKSCIC